MQDDQNYSINSSPNGDPQSKCPCCGYCPHCGRGGYQAVPFYPTHPVWPPYYPYVGDAPWYQPTITWNTTINGSSSSL